MVIEPRLPTPAEYQELRRAVGWKVPELHDAASALRSSTAGVVALQGDRTVGMARAVGDALFYNLVVDVVVRPDCHRRGFGLRLLQQLEREIRHVSTTGQIQLVAAVEAGDFYARAGYAESQDRLMTKHL